MSDMSTRPRKPKHLEDRSALRLKLNLCSKIIILSQKNSSSLAKHSLRESVWPKLIGSAKFPATACCSPCVHKQTLHHQAPKRTKCTQLLESPDFIQTSLFRNINSCLLASKPAAPRWRMQLLEAAGPRTTGLKKSNVNRTSSKLTVHYDTLSGVSMQHSFFRFWSFRPYTARFWPSAFGRVVTVVCSTGWFCCLLWYDLEAGSDWFVWAIATTDFAWLKLWSAFYLMGHLHIWAFQTLKIKPQQPPKARILSYAHVTTVSLMMLAGTWQACRKPPMK